MLDTKFPFANVTYSYNYGNTPESRQQALQALGKDVAELFDMHPTLNIQ
jgi:hypothetical protein